MVKAILVVYKSIWYGMLNDRTIRKFLSNTNLDANQCNLKCNNYLFKVVIQAFYSKMYSLHL